MKNRWIIIIVGIALILLAGCSNYSKGNELQNVGVLMQGEIEENAWNKKGYQGMQQIEEQFDVDVFVKENIASDSEIQSAINEFVKNGVNLIIGHSSIYGDYFYDLSESYPDVHFIYTNGGVYKDNITSLNFNSNTMGFFGGMIAALMSEENRVGVIGSYSWQPEIEGFYEGVKYVNPDAEVTINYTYSWEDKEKALEIYESMKEFGVDVFYPAGDAYSEAVLKQVEEDGLYAIGYVMDQYELAPDAVLTSTIQQVDKLYVQTAEEFNNGKLDSGVLTFDFQDEVIRLGQFNPIIPDVYKDYVKKKIDYYMETNLLPNER